MLNSHLAPQLLSLIHGINWANPAFSVEKAYVCSQLSAVAYENIPELELKGNNRFKIVPSETFHAFYMPGNKLMQSFSFSLA